MWWTPDPEPLLLTTSAVEEHELPRHLRNTQPVLMQCASCDGNKGHLLWDDLSRYLRKPFDDYVRTRKKQTITLPRSPTP